VFCSWQTPMPRPTSQLQLFLPRLAWVYVVPASCNRVLPGAPMCGDHSAALGAACPALAPWSTRNYNEEGDSNSMQCSTCRGVHHALAAGVLQRATCRCHGVPGPRGAHRAPRCGHGVGRAAAGRAPPSALCGPRPLCGAAPLPHCTNKAAYHLLQAAAAARCIPRGWCTVQR